MSWMLLSFLLFVSGHFAQTIPKHISSVLANDSIKLTLTYSHYEYKEAGGAVLLNLKGYSLQLDLNNQQPTKAAKCYLDSTSSYLIMQDERYCTTRLSARSCQFSCLNCFLRNSTTNQAMQSYLQPDSSERSCYRWTLCPLNQDLCKVEYHVLDLVSLEGGGFYDTSVRAMTTGEKFEWEYLSNDIEELVGDDGIPISPGCRIGLFSMVNYEGLNLFERWLTGTNTPPNTNNTSTTPIAQPLSSILKLDLTPTKTASTMVLNDKEALNDTDIKWTGRRLRFYDCQPDFYVFIYSVQVCGDDLMEDVGSMAVTFNLRQKGIQVPEFLFERIRSYFNLTCGDQTVKENLYLCELGSNYDLRNIDDSQLGLSFSVTSGGDEIHIPFAKLIYYDVTSERRYLKMSKRFEMSSGENQIKTITFGSEILESVYYYIDYRKQRMGFKNKLITTKQQEKSKLCMNKQPISWKKFYDRQMFCQYNGYREAPTGTKYPTCQLVTGVQVILTLIFVPLILVELLFALQYDKLSAKLKLMKSQLEL